MSTLQVMKFPDRHFHHVIFSLGPYIADYPEQVLLAGIVQDWCGRSVNPQSCRAPLFISIQMYSFP